MIDNERAARALYETEGAAWLMDKASPAYTDALLSLLGEHVREGDRALDLCCGYGRLTLPLRQRGVDVTGVDISETLLREGIDLNRQSGLSIRPYVAGSLTRLPFASASFDFAFCVWASFHFLLTDTDQQSGLSEIHRVLKPGGSVLIEGPVHEEVAPIQVVQCGSGSYHYNPITAEQMQELATQSSFVRYDISSRQIAGKARMLGVLEKA